MSSSEVDKFIELEEKLENVKTRKIRLEEQYKNKSQSLREVVDKIKKYGYDPKDLKNVIAKKEEDLKKQIKEFEDKLEKVSDQLSQIED